MKINGLLYFFALTTDAFSPHLLSRVSTRLHADTKKESAPAKTSKPKVKNELGLLTFDLDDTLFPIEPCIKAANGAYIIYN
jgi:hypothetical protein